jgi:hypothetical protein
MPDAMLTQHEADALLALEKVVATEQRPLFPLPGIKVEIPLQSRDGREAFLLDLSRGRIKLTKATYQNRCKHVVILARVDIDGPPHRNPDGQEILCPHLHLYREGFGDKWAQPIPQPFPILPTCGRLSKISVVFAMLLSHSRLNKD